MMFEQWKGFKTGKWQDEIDLRDFIHMNYTPYDGDDSFLSGPTERTNKCMEKVNQLLQEESDKGGVLDINTEVVSSITAYPPSYLDKDLDIIKGFQTDAPLKRGVNPFGGIRMARQACEAYGYKLGEIIEENFEQSITHNDDVFRMYTPEMKKARHLGLLTGLPDAYGRGRIIGDYRRVALYGVDYLIEEKRKDKLELGKKLMDVDNMRFLEELWKQIDSLLKLKEMAAAYGDDISVPAKNAREAIQWTYYAYLATNKEQNGAAMSMGRVSTFFDIYIQRDLENGTLTEAEAQELIDDFVIKLRLARHLRTPEYNELFGGDPMWITESIGGVDMDGHHMVTKSSFRILNTLYNLGPAPEPNLTVLWAERLPEAFKKFCAKVSIDTDAIQYENDDLMRPIYGDDYGIACCVSAMKIGKQMQFFGARCNLPKILLLTINGGYDCMKDDYIGPQMEPIKDEYLDFYNVTKRLEVYIKWMMNLYVNTMNVIHYSHDKWAYEKIHMALHDTEVERLMAFGVAGLSVITDSLSAIKYAKVKPIRDENGHIYDFEIEGDFPKFGNDDNRVDRLAQWVIQKVINYLRDTPAYRDAIHTLSVLTITSNVMYGKKTAATPDGRKAGEPFAPGANPMHNREVNGALASLNSVAKLSYDICRDGISNTWSITPDTLGKNKEERVDNLVNILEGYFCNGAHHINVNVLNRETLMDAYEHPEKYPNLTIRVSGYAVHFNKLSREQQREVISRTFHTSM
jgi:formate C-acetyltransferase